MKIIILLIFLFISIHSLVSPGKNRNVLNVTNNVNITYVKEEIKKYGKEYMDLHQKSSMNKEIFFCDKIELNIKAFEQIKKKYINFEIDIDKGTLNNMEMKDFLDIRGEISFSIRNIEIIVKNLQKKKLSCFKNDNEYENVKKDIKAHFSKNKENFLKSINNILKINNEL